MVWSFHYLGILPLKTSINRDFLCFGLFWFSLSFDCEKKTRILRMKMPEGDIIRFLRNRTDSLGISPFECVFYFPMWENNKLCLLFILIWVILYKYLSFTVRGLALCGHSPAFCGVGEIWWVNLFPHAHNKYAMDIVTIRGLLVIICTIIGFTNAKFLLWFVEI